MNQNRLLFTISIILLSAISLSAQKQKNITFGLFFTPKTSISIFENERLGDFNPIIGLNIQTDIIYEVNDKLDINLGLKYKLDRIENIDYSALLGCDFINGTSAVFNSWFEDQINIHYMGIPASVRYNMLGKANKVYVKLGYEFLIKLTEKQSSVLLECGTNELHISGNSLKSIKKARGNINLGIGFEINSGGRSKLMIEPEISYSVTKIYENDVFSSAINNFQLFDIGIKVGVSL